MIARFLGTGCGLLLLTATPLRAQSYSFSTLAGLPPQVGTSDGATTNARFNYPQYTAFDSAGSLFVADSRNHTIRKITPAGVVSTFAGAAGTSGTADGTLTTARFNQPTGLAFDGAGNLYVTDYASHTVRKITPAGVVTTLAGSAGVSGSSDGTGNNARFNSPEGIVADSSGNLYVADHLNGMIRKISPAGEVTTLAGVAGSRGATNGAGTSARFAQPAGITIDGAGNLFVADSSNATIRKINPAGVVSTLAGSADLYGTTNAVGSAARFNGPSGITIDGAGNLYVTDPLNNNIRKITPEGVVSAFAGSTAGSRGHTNGTGSSARFFYPVGISIDGAGSLFIADSNNQAIRKVTSASVASTFAGPAGGFGFDDGSGSAARFYYPRGIVVDSRGNLFVADEFYATIRKITPTGDVSTFAGAPGSYGSSDGTGNAARFSSPNGLAIDSNDNLYVADYFTDTIRKITPSGVVTTLAGSATAPSGSTDGVGANARFNGPSAVAIDASGNLFVADSLNCTIRKITPDGNVTTVAGTPGTPGGNDGTGSAARFFLPFGIAVDKASGTVYVADTYNQTIRRITTGGAVTTIAGLALTSGTADGTGPNARFRQPWALAVEANGNVLVADAGGRMIRRMTPSGAVTTIAGSPTRLFATHDGTGTDATFISPNGITTDSKGALYVTDSGTNAIVKGVLDTIPDISIQPRAVTALLGTSATLSVTATGGGLSYRWKLNGTPIPGATGASYTIASVSQSAAGNYTVDVINSAGVTTSTAVTLAVTLPGRLINLSVLTTLSGAGDSFTVGTVIGGANSSGAKPLLVRAVGPSLATLGVPDAHDNPKLELFAGAAKVGENDDWGGNAQISSTSVQVGAFPLAGATSKDAAVYLSDASGANRSITVSAVSSSTGLVIAELYDATPTNTYAATTPRLINVSVLKNITGGLTAGFVVGGTTPLKVLVRAIGPTLDSFGVGGTVADPKLELFDAGQRSVATNDDWGGAATLSSAFTSVGAFGLAPNSKDAALLVTLNPGNYTAQVTGAGNSTGVALVEVYEVP